MHAPEDSSDRLAQAKALFADALGQPSATRGELLERACADDRELLELVRRLLGAHAAAEHFMDAPSAAPELAATASEGAGEAPGSTIGPYRLLEQIGEGSFGAVHLAEQTEPVARQVALKILKLGMDTRQVIARFEAESQALAMMDHPGIARVLDAGTTERGRPYFVMELVRGEPLTTYCDHHALSTAERLRLLAEVCHAVQHAHQKGVIHRDLKPSNVLVTIVDGRPVPKVIDFGIAKAVGEDGADATLLTARRQLLGTPQYMSPEQASMGSNDVDTRSDVYSLGVLLYELLTGTTPFDPARLHAAGLGELQRIIRKEEPRTPSMCVAERMRGSRGRGGPSGAAASPQRNPLNRRREREGAASRGDRDDGLAQLQRELRGDLDWIVMKCLEKDRARRYEAANAVALDIERHLAGEPVTAAPPSRSYRVRKFVRRNRGGVVAGATIATALLIGVAGTATFAVRESAARRLAESNQSRVETELSRAVEIKRLLSEVLMSASPVNAMGIDTTLLRSILDDASRRLERHEITDPRVEAELRDIVGNSYLQIGQLDAAERHTTTALEARLRLLGPEDPESLISMVHVADLRAQQSRLSDAEAMTVRALGVLRRTVGERSAATLHAMTQLAHIYVMAGRYDEAETLAGEALGTARAALGEENQFTLDAMGVMALVCREMGNTTKAETMLREIIEIQRRLWGENHLGVLISEYTLTTLYKDIGRFDDAEALCRKTLNAATKVLGERHPQTLRVRTVLANIYEFQGRESECEALTLKNLADQEQVLGTENPEVFGTLYNLANLYARQHRYQDAETRYQRALDGQLETLGEANPATLATMYALGKLHVDTGRIDSAETLLSRAVEIQHRQPGTRNPGMIPSLNGLANVVQSQGRYAEAEPLRAEIFEIMRDSFGKERYETLVAMNKLAWLQWRLERYSAAADLLRQAIEIEEQQGDNGRSLALASASLLAQVCNGMGRYDEALAVGLKCLPEVQKFRHGDDPEITRTMAAIAEAYLGLGRREEATPLFRDALARQLSEVRRARVSNDAANEAAWILLTHPVTELRDPATALALVEQARAQTQEAPPVIQALSLVTLSMAQVATGGRDVARLSYQKAIAVAPGSDDPRLARRLAQCEAALKE